MKFTQPVATKIQGKRPIRPTPMELNQNSKSNINTAVTFFFSSNMKKYRKSTHNFHLKLSLAEHPYTTLTTIGKTQPKARTRSVYQEIKMEI